MERAETLVTETLRGHSSLEELADIAKDDVRLEPMKGGYLNHVFRALSTDESKSCILKVYSSYAKAFGPDTPLETERCRREKDSIDYFNSIVPLCCPPVIFHDEASNIVCLQDLRDYTCWGEYLLKSCDLQAGASLADKLVTLHSSSHRLKIGDAEFEKLKQKFSSLPLQTSFLHDVHFTKPFLVGSQSKEIPDQSVRQKLDEVKADAAVTKALTLAKEWMAVGAGDCCIHGDLHADSLMLKGDDIKMIDLECARVGPPAFDVALLVCSYVLLYHYHQQKALQEGDGEDDGLNHNYVRRHILDLICITLSRYMEGMGRLLGDSYDHHQMWKQVLLLLGVEIITWISGPPSLPQLDVLPEAQLNCLNTALRILHKQSLSLDTHDLSCLIHN